MLRFARDAAHLCELPNHLHEGRLSRKTPGDLRIIETCLNDCQRIAQLHEVEPIAEREGDVLQVLVEGTRRFKHFELRFSSVRVRRAILGL